MTAIAYVVTAYPALSNTFVQREITALESLSDKSGEHFEVLRFSVNRPSAQDLLTDVHQSEAARTTYIKGQSLSAWKALRYASGSLITSGQTAVPGAPLSSQTARVCAFP